MRFVLPTLDSLNSSGNGLYGCFRKNRKYFWGKGGNDYQKAMDGLSGVKERGWCGDGWKDDGHTGDDWKDDGHKDGKSPMSNR